MGKANAVGFINATDQHMLQPGLGLVCLATGYEAAPGYPWSLPSKVLGFPEPPIWNPGAWMPRRGTPPNHGFSSSLPVEKKLREQKECYAAYALHTTRGLSEFIRDDDTLYLVEFDPQWALTDRDSEWRLYVPTARLVRPVEAWHDPRVREAWALWCVEDAINRTESRQGLRRRTTLRCWVRALRQYLKPARRGEIASEIAGVLYAQLQAESADVHPNDEPPAEASWFSYLAGAMLLIADPEAVLGLYLMDGVMDGVTEAVGDHMVIGEAAYLARYATGQGDEQRMRASMVRQSHHLLQQLGVERF